MSTVLHLAGIAAALAFLGVVLAGFFGSFWRRAAPGPFPKPADWSQTTGGGPPPVQHGGGADPGA